MEYIEYFSVVKGQRITGYRILSREVSFRFENGSTITIKPSFNYSEFEELNVSIDDGQWMED